MRPPPPPPPPPRPAPPRPAAPAAPPRPAAPAAAAPPAPDRGCAAAAARTLRRSHTHLHARIASWHCTMGGWVALWRARPAAVRRYDPIVIANLQQAARTNAPAAYKRFSELSDEQTRKCSLRGLLEFKPTQPVSAAAPRPVSSPTGTGSARALPGMAPRGCARPSSAQKRGRARWPRRADVCPVMDGPSRALARVFVRLAGGSGAR